MKIINLSETNSVLNHYLAEMRDVEIQTDAEKFRWNMQKSAWFLAFEISKTLNYHSVEIQTPLAQAKLMLTDENLVICSILRAALPLHNAFLDVFPKAENAFIGAYRKPTSNVDFEICVDYQAMPNMQGKHILLVDPMLATGKTIVAVCEHICQKFQPSKITLASVFAAPEGLELLKNKNVVNTVFTCVIDEKLNAKSYIVPGLGDAGDLSFGIKM